MSYVEHGSRIFLTGLPSTGMPLAYGDHVLTRKRSEGKLKLHDSCSDLRAWSPNSLESSQYFRELTEHVTPSGNIIPFNVIIDHIIGLTSKAQNELHFTKRELQKYKTLKLTPRQQEQIKNFDKIHSESDQRLRESSHNKLRKSLFKNAFFDFSKSLSRLHPYPQIPIHLRRYPLKGPEKPLTRNASTSKPETYGEYANVALQVEVAQNVRDIGMQVDEYPLIKVSLDSVQSQASLIYQFNTDQNDPSRESESQISDTDRSVDYDLSDARGSQNSENQLDLKSENLSMKDLIEKESKIVALRHDAREIELQELQNANEKLQNLLQEKEENLNSLQESLKVCHHEIIEIELRRVHEIEEMKNKLSVCTTLIEQLKEDMNAKDQTYGTQAQEIAQLQPYVDEVVTLRVQNETFANKIKELEEKATEAKACSTTLEQLESVLREKEILQKQTHEQSCILACKEDEAKRLTMLVKQMSLEWNQQKKLDQSKKFESLIKDLNIALQNKDIQLSQYEKRMIAMRKEVSVFFSNLRKSLNNFDELNQMCDDSNSSTKCEFDVNEEADSVLYNMNVVMTRLQNYKMERQDLLQEIQELKYNVQRTKQDYMRELQARQRDGVSLLNVTDNTARLSTSQNRDHPSESEDEEYPCGFVESGSSYPNEKNSLPHCAINETFSNTDCEINEEDEVEQQIIKQVSYAIQKVESVVEEFRDYAEVAQPELFKRIKNVGIILNDIAIAMSNSQNKNSRKELISEVYKEFKEKHDIEDGPNNIPSEIHEAILNMYKSIGTVLYEQLKEISFAETMHLNDKQVDEFFSEYLRSCIMRTREVLAGVERRRLLVEEVLNKQALSIQNNNKEINCLKQIVEKYRTQNDRSQNDLRKTASQLSERKETMTKLEEKLRLSEIKLSTSTKDCMHLKELNKSLENEKGRLAKECQLKNDKIKSQTTELRSLKSVADNVNILKNEMSKKENRLLSLMFENDGLRAKLMTANEKDEIIKNLRKSITAQENTNSHKLSQCKQLVEERQSELLTLKTENETLNQKLSETERELSKKREEMMILSEENNKVNLIHMLQKDLAGLSKSEEKLKGQLNKLKTLHINDQNRSKKMESELDVYLRQNETLRKNIEYWKNENAELLQQLQQQTILKSSNKRIRDLSSELYDRIHKLMSVPNDISENYTALRKEFKEIQRVVEAETNINSNIDENEGKCDWLPKKVNETIHSRDEMIKELNSTIKQLENETIQRQNEIDRLRHDVNAKDSEIKQLKESRNALIQEKSYLQDVRQHEIDDYQKKITLMKKNYNSSVHALCAKHKESVMRLEMRFQDTIMHGKNCFEPEAHLESLDTKHSLGINNYDLHVTENDINHQTKAHADDNYTSIGIIHTSPEKPERLNVNSNESSKAQSHSNTCVERKHRFYANETVPNEHSMQFLSKSGDEMTIIESQDNRIHQQKNIRLCDADKLKLVSTDMKYLYRNTENNNNFDQQRWNFISRCSLHLKLGNTRQNI